VLLLRHRGGLLIRSEASIGASGLPGRLRLSFCPETPWMVDLRRETRNQPNIMKNYSSTNGKFCKLFSLDSAKSRKHLSLYHGLFFRKNRLLFYFVLISWTFVREGRFNPTFAQVGQENLSAN
jgi:hypothetical protein